MNSYLLPAGYEFQKVQQDYERLLAGKELFDRGTLEELDVAEDNNDRHKKLKRIREDLLPLYDDVRTVAPEVIRVAAEAIKRARNTATVPIETTFGNFDGRTAEDVANEAIQLIDDIRYIDIEHTFRVLCDLFVTARSHKERERILRSIEGLARYDLDVWKQVGFGVQKVLYDGICALSELEKKALRPVIAAMCGLFLSTDLQGMTWQFNSASLHRAAVPVSAEYEEFRSSVLALLFDLYRTATSVSEKIGTEQALSSAMRFPMDGGPDNLVAMVLDQTRQIVQFFADRVDDEPFEVLQHIEQQFLWLYRRTREIAVVKRESAIPDKAQAVVAAIENFRDRANTNDGFVKFKTLVGFEFVFPPEWDGDPMDIAGQHKYRADKIRDYAASVSTENADEWFEVIEQCAAVKSNDAATFPTFGEFLKQLAARSPNIVVSYLRKHEAALSNFIPAILEGLAQSDQPDIAVSFITAWIGQGRHLHAIAHYLRYATNTSEELVLRVGEKAIAQKDAIAAIGVIVAIVARKLTSLVDSILLPSVQMLTDLKDARWVNGCWFLPSLGPFVEGLSQEQSEALLTNMVLRQRVEHHDERVLCAVAGKHPECVLSFFKARMDHNEDGETEERYEAVPYHMVDLGKVLARHPKVVLRSARSWYSSGDSLFTFTGGRLLQNIFPELTQEYEAELLELVRGGVEDDVNFVLSLLGSYRGGVFLYELCKALIEGLPEVDKRIRQIGAILDSTGVVSGEFGMVEVYQRKKEEMQSWHTDPRSKVRAFANAHIPALDRSIAAEQWRSETDYESGAESGPKRRGSRQAAQPRGNLVEC